MAYVTVGQENSANIDLYYEDHGSGQPVVLVHGWPLSGHSWEKQEAALLEAGYRVITYDRRGFGESSQPSTGYDYDTLTADLNTLMNTLDLRDVILVGFSMGNGEVVHYLGQYGSERVSKVVMLAPLPPYLVQTDDNPSGVPKKVFDDIMSKLRADRPRFLNSFMSDFYNVDVFGGSRVSDEVVRLSWEVAAGASAKGTHDCVPSWLTDFRGDVRRITAPTLIMQGDADRVLPIDSTGNQLEKLIDQSQYVVLHDAPHGLIWTHAEDVNQALLDFANQ